jgi:hypothetical protein
MIKDFNSIDELKDFGFTGFYSVNELQNNRSIITTDSCVYIIINPQKGTPQFMRKGVGGSFKGKDPNVSICKLVRNYIEDACVLYIGESSELRSRINSLLNFGQGKAADHWGGRMVWQFRNHADLIICWKPVVEIKPSILKKDLLDSFINQFGRLPFAVLRSCN